MGTGIHSELRRIFRLTSGISRTGNHRRAVGNGALDQVCVQQKTG